MTAAPAPVVSVVVPVHEDSAGLARCLAALARQDLPLDQVEVVVCDNGSGADRARAEDVASAHPRATLLVTDEPGSYRARNTCLAVARGRVVALTDADCVPEPSWLRRGLEAVDADGVDIAAGRVRVFAQHSPPTPVELYEVRNAFPQEHYVRTLGFGVTANLFVRREVFDRVGPFDEVLRSGGDREFCERAGRAGARLTYAEQAVVDHPARSTVAEVAEKTRRVVRGAVDAGLAPPTTRQWLRQALPPLGAPARAVATYGTWRDRVGYVGGEVVSHYLRWWMWRSVVRAR